MDERTLELSDLIRIIKRYWLDTILITVLCLEAAALVAMYLPKKYKSKAILSIQSSYFRNPLVSDLVTEITDPGELNAQRQGLLRLALNDQFLDSLGEEYGIFETTRDDERRAAEREGLLKRIEYYSLSPSNFQISMTAGEPRVVFEMTRQILDQMKYTLIEERFQRLVKARDAIQTQVQFLSRALSSHNSPGQSEYLQVELDKINSNIAALRTKFTDNHPELAKLRSRASTLQSQISKAPPPPRQEFANDDVAAAFVIPSSKQPVQDIFNDLLKKLSHLNIVLEMEKDREDVSYLSIIEQPTIPGSAFSPRVDLTMLFGLVSGLVLSLLAVVYNELRQQQNVTSNAAADFLEIPLLGELPYVESKTLRLLDAPANISARRLPFTAS
jgi:capsular polysaccharide biosynthesis protein